ncbi:hypothetical protein EVJ50_13210 [Synechococcus sp. RSCCF101]|uniref:hypothetical protein n=1 Tax=Synechococcus sp. RSCCF101 TaxID=2511069 RepID=UPI001247F3F3|nr:hypothetical protein [Synechococcus sp. RSCCF101]QEY33046.1 hypothetical protein EVJ50_13210 [Synechococcus sp. RSCCF101]
MSTPTGYRIAVVTPDGERRWLTLRRGKKVHTDAPPLPMTLEKATELQQQCVDERPCAHLGCVCFIEEVGLGVT